MCSVGSAPLAPYVVERLQEKMPDALVSNNYGMTEAGSAYCVMPKGEAVKRPGSVGQIAPPAVVRIVDEHDQQLPPDVVGEVRLQMPGRQREYFQDPEATAEMWRDGWLVTGDLGKLDADGYLYIVGRSKDVIIRGGNNVHATDVEHALVQHEAVKEVAVVGAPHPVLGEDVVAFVVLHPGVGGRRRGAAGLRARAPGRLQGAAPVRLRRRAAPQPDRQGRQARAAGSPGRHAGLITLPRPVAPGHAADHRPDIARSVTASTCDAPMNSAGFFARWSRDRRHRLVYSVDHDRSSTRCTTGRTVCQQGGQLPGQSRLAMSEVQICGIPKLSLGEVAPTP